MMKELWNNCMLFKSKDKVEIVTGILIWIIIPIAIYNIVGLINHLLK